MTKHKTFAMVNVEVTGLPVSKTENTESGAYIINKHISELSCRLRGLTLALFLFPSTECSLPHEMFIEASKLLKTRNHSAQICAKPCL